MAHEFHTRRIVEFSETDAAGIVHFSVFFRWMEAAEHAFLRSLHLPVLRRVEGREYGWPRVRAQCAYHAPLYFGDTVHVHLAVKELKDHGVVYACRFLRIGDGDPVVCASGEWTTLIVERASADSPMKAVLLPDDFRAALSEAPADCLKQPIPLQIDTP